MACTYFLQRRVEKAEWSIRNIEMKPNMLKLLNYYSFIINPEMIVELIEQQGLLLAVNHRGELLLWDISPPQHNRPLHFPHNVSILPSTLRVSLDAKELVGIITLGTHFLAFNRRNLYIAEFT